MVGNLCHCFHISLTRCMYKYVSPKLRIANIIEFLCFKIQPSGMHLILSLIHRKSDEIYAERPCGFFFCFYFGSAYCKINYYSSEITSNIWRLQLHPWTNRCIQIFIDVGIQGFTSTSEQTNHFERVHEPSWPTTEYLNLPLNRSSHLRTRFNPIKAATDEKSLAEYFKSTFVTNMSFQVLDNKTIGKTFFCEKPGD